MHQSHTKPKEERKLRTGEKEHHAPNMNFMVNGQEYNKAYYLANGIYPRCRMFVKIILLPQTPKQRMFAACLEGAWKDVERSFGMLKLDFIFSQPMLLFFHHVLSVIMCACIILHTMIEDEHRRSCGLDDYKTVESFIPHQWSSRKQRWALQPSFSV